VFFYVPQSIAKLRGIIKSAFTLEKFGSYA